MIRTIKLEDMDFIHSYNLGYAVKTRVGEAVNKGLLIQDNHVKDYMLTMRAMSYINFWRWLQGDNDSLVSRPSILD